MESAYPLFEAGVVRAGVFEWGPKCRWERMANVTAKAGQAAQDSRERARSIMTTLRDKYGLELIVVNMAKRPKCGDDIEPQGPHSQPTQVSLGAWVRSSLPSAQWELSRLSDAEGIECVLQWLDKCGGEISLWVQKPLR